MNAGIHMIRIGARRASVISVLSLALFLLFAANSSWGQQDERSVRIAFVYNLTKYVTWPTANQNLNICVYGEGSTASSIREMIDGKQSDGRTVRVIIRPPELNARLCSIAYFPKASRNHESSGPIKAVTGSVLTVGEDENFVREGGMVAFVRAGDSIQIEINPDNVKAAGLNISSRLLDLAVLIHKGKRG